MGGTVEVVVKWQAERLPLTLDLAQPPRALKQQLQAATGAPAGASRGR
jgi:hypothetical protein